VCFAESVQDRHRWVGTVSSNQPHLENQFRVEIDCSVRHDHSPLIVTAASSTATLEASPSAGRGHYQSADVLGSKLPRESVRRLCRRESSTFSDRRSVAWMRTVNALTGVAVSSRSHGSFRPTVTHSLGKSATVRSDSPHDLLSSQPGQTRQCHDHLFVFKPPKPCLFLSI
jgi:hypothetical protein